MERSQMVRNSLTFCVLRGALWRDWGGVEAFQLQGGFAVAG